MKIVKTLTLWIPISALLVVGFNNCGQSNFESSLDLSSLGIQNDEMDSEKLGLPYALLSAEQTLNSMLSVTNVGTANTAIINEYNTRYGALAGGNDLSMANSPVMLGSTSLAGEVCNSLVTAEKAATAETRNFFGSVDFAVSVGSITDSGFNSSVRGMARSFWGRNETADELSFLQEYKLEFIAALTGTALTQVASTSNLITATCAAMLSSLDAISY